ncbi:MAG: ATP-binding protein [bacterium]
MNILSGFCAFANTDGGRLLIGVDDNGNPVGLKDSKKLLEDLLECRNTSKRN